MTLPASGALTLDNIQTEFGGTNPIGLNEYYAGGGLVPVGTSGTYGAVPSTGTLTIQNFYGTSNYTPVYIEELFSTYLYTGTGATQTITNGIDLAGKGGLVWTKSRSNAISHVLIDTVRGAGHLLSSNLTAQDAYTTDTQKTVTGFSSTGYTLGTDSGNWGTNLNSSYTYASWTFRKQPKFFDVVTYTGDGTSSRIIPHNLQSTPGALIIKATSTTGDWFAWCRTSTSGSFLKLNSTAAQVITGNPVLPSAFLVSTSLAGMNTNQSGVTYVAYLFAHNAGGFGLTGTDNIISCGSYTGNGSASGPTITLGYEPQWVMVKNASNLGQWEIYDSMRGLTMGGEAILRPNTSGAEVADVQRINPTATGFSPASTDSDVNGAGDTYIYIAIRRPHRVPTDASKVFGINLYSGTGSQQTITTPFNAPDAALSYVRNASGWSSPIMYDRLRGPRGLFTDQTAAEIASADYGAVISTNARAQEIVGMFGSSSGKTYVTWSFARAPGFFDEVCYTGNGAGDRSLTSNLGGPPELCIVKARSTTSDWNVSIGSAIAGIFTQRYYTYLRLNKSDSQGTTNTSFAFTGPPYASILGVPSAFNTNGTTYVAYLFATCPGVSKVGSYTGTGTAQQINCGFTAGARFVMIKRTDSGGAWLVFDSARGIVSGNDPYLYLNSTIYGEITIDNFIHPYSAGFQLTNSPYGAEVNANGGSYIYLAIA